MPVKSTKIKISTEEKINRLKRRLFPKKSKYLLKEMQFNFLDTLIQATYPKDSIVNKKFYNVGAGNQRSNYDIWSYIDLKSDSYKGSGIDIFHDLESLADLPLDGDSAEVIFNSFVMEHISWGATKKLAEDAFKALKPGGVFHSKVHCYDYGVKLWQQNLLPMQLFQIRESRQMILNFIERFGQNITSTITADGAYTLSSKDGHDMLQLTPSDLFFLHNATCAQANLTTNNQSTKTVLDNLFKGDTVELYQQLQQAIDQDKKLPYQHNADYINADMLMKHLTEVGFSKVYSTQPFQSISPVLWEEKINRIHHGFTFSVEAVK